jgi:hypothetical protein
MAEASPFQSEEFLKLLTDALRAGPGSPQWRDVVTLLRSENAAEADEYQLLITARERLESGREFRSIRPGPGFTRKVMQAVDQERASKTPIPSATLIAVIAAAAILTILIVVAVMLSTNPAPSPTPQDLASTYFGNTIISGDFSQNIPVDWKKFGLEPVISIRDKVLRGGFAKDGNKDYRGGGLVAATPIDPGQSFAVEATLRMPRASTDVDLFIFVTEEASFDRTPTATSPREFVVDLINGQLSIFNPDGTLKGRQATIAAGRDPIHLLIKMDRQNAIIELDGKRLYEGPHGLVSTKPRYPGIRFLTQGSEKSLDDVVVQSVRVLKP